MRILHKGIFRKIFPIVTAVIVFFTSVANYCVFETAAVDKFQAAKNLIKPYVDALKEIHPEWEFEYYDTGLEWSTVISEEMVISRNLVPNSPHLFMVKGVDSAWHLTPTSWKSVTVAGAYNWKPSEKEINEAGMNPEGDWVELSGGGWVQVSEEALEYVMDPRNWITEENIFSFEQLSYNPDVHTEEMLITMMEDSYMDCDYATVGGSKRSGDDAKRTYAQVLIEAAEKYNVSPVYLCSKLLYEKGRGTVKNGKYVMSDTLGTGVSTDDEGVTFHAKVSDSDATVYYNMFNIGAGGSDMAAVINNGGREALAAGWTSQYKAIMGGVEKIANKYVAIGQTTLYFQKFAVSVPENYRYWKQYQQSVIAAVNEGYNNMEAYRDMGVLDSKFSFIIPVYYDMPESVCEMPSSEAGTANPNYKLNSLKVTGTDIFGNTQKLSLTPSFDMDTYKYSIVVPYVTNEINIKSVPIASTTTVTGTGKFTLEVGNNTFKIRCKSEYGTVKNYTLNITREAGSTLMKKISSSGLKLDTGFASDILSYSADTKYENETIQFKFIPDSNYARVVLADTDTVYEGADDLVETLDGGDTGDSNDGLDVSESGITHGITSTVLKYNDSKGYGKTPLIYLKEGDNIINFDVYPSEDDDSTFTRYTVTVHRTGKVKVDFNELQVTDDGYISNFAMGDTVKSAKSKIKISNGKIEITDKDGNVKTSGKAIVTGDLINIKDKDGYLVDSYTVILYGDVNGDGKTDIFDFAYIRKMIIKGNGLSGVYLMAADVYPESEGVDIYDFAIIRRYLIKGTAIKQERQRPKDENS